MSKQGFASGEALMVGNQVHTSPQQFSKVMSLVKPRLIAGYPFFSDFDTEPAVRDGVRDTNDELLC